MITTYEEALKAIQDKLPTATEGDVKTLLTHLETFFKSRIEKKSRKTDDEGGRVVRATMTARTQKKYEPQPLTAPTTPTTSPFA